MKPRTPTIFVWSFLVYLTILTGGYLYFAYFTDNLRPPCGWSGVFCFKPSDEFIFLWGWLSPILFAVTVTYFLVSDLRNRDVLEVLKSNLKQSTMLFLGLTLASGMFLWQLSRFDLTYALFFSCSITILFYKMRSGREVVTAKSNG
jgi:hypothetical protein